MSKLADEMMQHHGPDGISQDTLVEWAQEVRRLDNNLDEANRRYGFEKVEVQRHVQLYKDYQKKFKKYYFTAEKKIVALEDKIARYERDVSDE